MKAAIIGAGPAGIASAIYLHRVGLEPILIEKKEPGGLLRNANLVENYPGFPKGVSGSGLAKLFSRHLTELGIKVTKARVDKILRKGTGFVLETDVGKITADTVIVATGTRPKKLGIPSEASLTGRKIFYEVVDMPLKRRKEREVVVIGGGDAAFDYALNLTGKGHRVTILSRSRPRCLGLLEDRAAKEGITVMTDLMPRSVKESSGKVVLSCSGGKGASDFSADFVLIASGREPELDVLDGSLGSGLRLIDGGPRTNIPGLYLVGDVIRGSRRQTGIAVGDGVHAAMLADERVGEKGVRE
jgi:thioredoxin reductase